MQGLYFFAMRYHYEKPKEWSGHHGMTYRCDHMLYSRCTLFREGDLGLAVVQQRFNKNLKCYFYGPIDPWLIDDIYNNPLFGSYFSENAGNCKDGIFPTVEIRKLMWRLRMKPLETEEWVPKLHLI